MVTFKCFKFIKTKLTSSVWVWLGGKSSHITSHNTWHELSDLSSGASTNVLYPQQ